MSWSVSAVGKASGVAAKLAADFKKISLAEPERSIMLGVASIVACALVSFPASMAVKVEASGSQSVYPPTANAANQLKVSIEPLWGFVE